jgi:hypothetical protein
MFRIIVVLSLLCVAACGEVAPGGPGHEPPSGGTVNPVSGTRSNGK